MARWMGWLVLKGVEDMKREGEERLVEDRREGKGEGRGCIL